MLWQYGKLCSHFPSMHRVLVKPGITYSELVTFDDKTIYLVKQPDREYCGLEQRERRTVPSANSKQNTSTLDYFLGQYLTPGISPEFCLINL